MYQISRCRGSQYCCRITWIVDHTLINIYAFSFYPDGKIVADTIVSGFAVKTVFRRTTIMSFGETFINVPAFNNTITCVSIRTSAVKALISIDTISICVTVMKFQVTFVFGRVENRIIARLPEKTKVRGKRNFSVNILNVSKMHWNFSFLTMASHDKSHSNTFSTKILYVP